MLEHKQERSGFGLTDKLSFNSDFFQGGRSLLKFFILYYRILNMLKNTFFHNSEKNCAFQNCLLDRSRILRSVQYTYSMMR